MEFNQMLILKKKKKPKQNKHLWKKKKTEEKEKEKLNSARILAHVNLATIRRTLT